MRPSSKDTKKSEQFIPGVVFNSTSDAATTESPLDKVKDTVGAGKAGHFHDGFGDIHDDDRQKTKSKSEEATRESADGTFAGKPVTHSPELYVRRRKQ